MIHLGYDILYVFVSFQQFDGEESGREALSDLLIFLQIFLQFCNALFYDRSMVDMDMSYRIMGKSSFIHLDDGVEEFVNTTSTLEDRGNHRESQQFTQLLRLNMITTLLGLIKHIQGTHHLHVHIDQLGGEIKVSLQITGIDDVDNDIGCLVNDLFTYIQLLRTVGTQGVSAGEIHKIQLISFIMGHALLGIYGNTTVVSNAFMSTGSEVEQRCLTTVGVSNQCDIDDTTSL